MTKQIAEQDWQLQHYASVGKAYGEKHFTRADSEFTNWVLDQLYWVQPTAKQVAEIGAGTCVFASLLGKKVGVIEPVTCYEPVAQLLEAAVEFDNVTPICGGAVEFARQADNNQFDLIYTKDTAHHFPLSALDEIHQGICDKLASGGRYAMVVRSAPCHQLVPVGELAAERWPTLYTSLEQLLKSLRAVEGWKEVEVGRWQKHVETSLAEWVEGIRAQDSWSIFSALNESEIETTVAEVEDRFGPAEQFSFLHQYDVAVFEKF